jgi:hypothetical protein
MPSPDDVLSALGDFVSRLDQLYPESPEIGELTVGAGARAARLPLRDPVARALIEALRAYHDPHDHGTCAHCGTGRLDENFICRQCGIVNGVFGQILADQMAAQRRPELGTAP